MSKQPPGKPQPPTPPQPQPIPVYPPQVNHRSRLSGPGVGLIIAGALSAISSIVFAVWAIIIAVAAAGVSQVTASMDQIDSDAEIRVEDQKMISEVSDSISFFGHGASAGLIIFGALIFVSSCVIAYGGIQMTRGRSYGLCVFAAILALLPSGCWILSLPMGIWAIIVLLDNQVKAQFT